MESKYQIALSPNGNGGIFDALEQHGILADMKQRGLKHCHIYGVDNVLVKVADPTFIGFASDKNIQCVNKVVLKEDPSEKVGVMAIKNGQCTIVEYSELPEAMGSLRKPDGELVYNAGNIVQHYFSVDFLQTTVGNQLDYHLATKEIPSINENGDKVAPSAPNGTKLEMFIFDIFERISLSQIAALVANRFEEFAAVKNRSGVDSPETARTLLSNYHKQLATNAGAHFLGDTGSLFEISPLVSYQGEDLEKACREQTFQLPCNLESKASI
jgi:UDP-N-acetylglucosamine/UDP-N-acetylgalactosamine diphosphorylase